MADDARRRADGRRCAVRLTDRRALARAAADLIAELAAESIAARGRFHVALAGGSTPLDTYELLADAAVADTRWRMLCGDERCLPTGHPDRNSTSIERAWPATSRPGADWRPVPTERDAQACAAAYAPIVASALPFDLVILGLGEDGHTASLFPGDDRIECIDPDQPALVVPVVDAPKPPPERVSLTPRALRRARRQLVLTAGPNKRSALDRWQAGADLPITRITRGMDVTLLLADTE